MSMQRKFMNSAARQFAPIEPDYGVSNDDQGNVVLELGAVAPLSLPRDSAIKLALLILKRAGVEVDLGQGH